MTTYREYTVYETPPPTQGLTALMTLNILDGLEVASHPVHSAEHLHFLLEATKIAYADRDRWIGDPQHVDVPVEMLLSKEYAARRRRLLDPKIAQRHRFGGSEGDTTGFVVADGRGNLMSGIQSLFKTFGSGVMVPGTGVVLHNRGASFTTDPDHPNRFAPRKRPFHTLMAGIVTRETEPVIGYATSGGDGQAMFHVQGLTNLLDYGMDIQEAVERPRFAFAPSTPGESTGTFKLEGRVAPDVVTELARRGHRLERIDDFAYQVGHAQGVTRRDRTLTGGADPRGDGAALGY
jgi:gamma-glutamyltranspeptidase/glutathione hydrolase